MFEFIIGLAVGTVVTGVIFIVFGKNNKRKIEAARAEIVGLYNQVDSKVRSGLEKVELLLKK